jgi:hypothetical protein
MKFSLIAIAANRMFTSAIAGHRGLSALFGARMMPASASRAQIAVTAETVMAPNADRRKQLERAIAQAAQKERWWMLFVGITLVGYRLLRKHQALFENSFLYPTHEYSSSEGLNTDLSTDLSNDQVFESFRNRRSAA